MRPREEPRRITISGTSPGGRPSQRNTPPDGRRSSSLPPTQVSSFHWTGSFCRPASSVTPPCAASSCAWAPWPFFSLSAIGASFPTAHMVSVAAVLHVISGRVFQHFADRYRRFGLCRLCAFPVGTARLVCDDLHFSLRP